MNAPTPSEAEVSPFDLLIDAWRSGRPIVPLFGAGLSANTGIPLTATMVDYLAKVSWLYQENSTERLLRHGWPDLYGLNGLILREWEARERESLDSRKVLPQVVRERISDLKLKAGADLWLVLLQQLCDGKQELKDLYFARLELGRVPTSDHQFAAFLASLMGWPLILTTNFDTLLEAALRSQLLAPTIYEIPEGGRVPDPGLVNSSAFSVVKLHGGAYGRLMSETLKYSLHPEELKHLLAYFPCNPLLLVLGYGGGDRRVMSLVEALVSDRANEKLYPVVPEVPRLLWIHRDEQPPQSVRELVASTPDSQRGRIAHRSYRDGGWFLQELYCRVTSSHPVTRTSYRAFVQAPPKTPFTDFPRAVDAMARKAAYEVELRAHGVKLSALQAAKSEHPGNSKIDEVLSRAEEERDRLQASKLAAQQEFEDLKRKLEAGDPIHARSLLDQRSPPDLSRVSIAAFLSDTPGSGTSTALAQAVERIPGLGELIWCDLEPVATLDGLMQFLQERFRRFDPQLPPFAFLRTGERSLSQLPASEGEDDPRVDYVVKALQRGRYTLALDSMGEFGTSFGAYTNGLRATPGHSGSAEAVRITKQSQLLRDFLVSLFRRRSEFGESRILLSHTRQDTNTSLDEPIRELQEMAKGPGKDVIVEKVNNTQYHRYLFTELKQRFGYPEPPAAEPDVEGSPAASARDLVESIWADWKDDDPRKSAFALVSCFRRRRDLVAVRRLLLRVVRPVGGRPTLEELFRAANPRSRDARILSIAQWSQGIGSEDRKAIDRFLNEMEPLLIRQEGGTFWMHPIVRSTFYDSLRDRLGAGVLSDVHDLIAIYYYSDLFCSSNDPTVLFEYVFQRLLSLQTDEERTFTHRLQDLCVVLSRERDHLLRDTHPGSLVRCIARCREFGLRPGAFPASSTELSAARTELQKQLCELEAEAYRQASRFDDCLAIRNRQIADRLLELFAARYEVLHPRLLDPQESPPPNEKPGLAELIGRFRERGLFQAPENAIDGIVERFQDQPTDADFNWVAVHLLDPILSAMDEKSRKLPEAFFRLLEHLVECAHCRLEQGNTQRENSARELLERVRGVCQAILHPEIPSVAFSQYGILSRRAPRTERNHCNDVRIRCAHRLMEAYLRPVCIWKPAESDSAMLQNAVAEYADVQGALQEYRGWQDRSYYHYACFLDTLRARAAYLQRPNRNATPAPSEEDRRRLEKRFSLAYLFLDAARSAIRQPLKGSDWSAIAIIHLHHVECEMLHANDEVERASEARESAREKLKRAESHLNQARISLQHGRPQIWAWTWIRILEAQLVHEGLLDALTSAPAAAKDGAFRRGLEAIRRGLGTCGENERRKEQLDVLWKQFTTCYIVDCVLADRKAPASEVIPQAANQWEQVNRLAGLANYHSSKPMDRFVVLTNLRRLESVLQMDAPAPRRADLIQWENSLIREQDLTGHAAAAPDVAAKPRKKRRRSGGSR